MWNSSGVTYWKRFFFFSRKWMFYLLSHTREVLGEWWEDYIFISKKKKKKVLLSAEWFCKSDYLRKSKPKLGLWSEWLDKKNSHFIRHLYRGFETRDRNVRWLAILMPHWSYTFLILPLFYIKATQGSFYSLQLRIQLVWLAVLVLCMQVLLVT